MLGIVCGTQREAQVLSELGRHLPVTISVSAADPDRAEQIARDLANANCTTLLSAGVAGGLDPALAPGDMILAREVIDGKRRLATRPPPLVDATPQWLDGTIAGVDQAVLTPDAKRMLHQNTGAHCVDMESHRVARAAEAAGLGMIAIRVVADDASRLIPKAALAGLDRTGREVVWPVVTQLARTPSSLPALLRLSRDYERAFRSLSRCLAQESVIRWLTNQTARQ